MKKLLELNLSVDEVAKILDKHKDDLTHHKECFQMIVGGYIPDGENPYKHRPRQIWQCHKDCKIKFKLP